VTSTEVYLLLFYINDSNIVAGYVLFAIVPNHADKYCMKFLSYYFSSPPHPPPPPPWVEMYKCIKDGKDLILFLFLHAVVW
jgi:hypothetical protein